MNTYEAKVKGSNGMWTPVRVQANSRLDAQRLLEAQYGKANVMIVYEVT